MNVPWQMLHVSAQQLQVWEPLPSIIFGVVALVTGGLSFLLPETLGKEMPDTFEEALIIGK